MNIRKSFTILSYLFRMSADKLSYENFYEGIAKELWKKRTVDTRELLES